MMTAAFTDATSATRALLAGDAKITLVSRSTGVRYTYQITRAKPRPGTPANAPRSWFVSLLTGPDNVGDFTYLGMLREGFGNDPVRFTLTAKSRLPADAAPVKAISWTSWVLQDQGKIPSTLEIWHEGCCCRCGRTLTVPESIASGLGPECAKKAA